MDRNNRDNDRRYIQDPYSHGCAIKAAFGNTVEGTASGILIDPRQGFVLTHASLLYPLQEHFHPDFLSNIRLHGSSIQGKKVLDSTVTIEVILPNTGLDGDGKIMNFDEKNIQPVLSGTGLLNVSSFSKYRGTVKMVFECKQLRNTIRHLLPKESWQFEAEIDSASQENQNVDLDESEKLTNLTEKKTKLKSDDLYYSLLPCFILIEIKPYQAKDKIMRPVNINFLTHDSSNSKAGDKVEICATPFGAMSPEVFLNSRSRGIISKVAGPRNVLLMTDARCVPGCEGGGLFTIHKGQRYLTGIMIASLCWRNNEWVGLSMACGISSLLGSLRHLTSLDIQQHSRAGYEQGLVRCLSSQIVCVSVGANWGSGIILDPHTGIILTCSHVLKGSEHSKVKVVSRSSQTSYVGEIKYRTPPGKQLDLAVVQCQGHINMRPDSVLSLGEVNEGDVVYVLGYAVFRDTLDPRPMVTRGVISKINTCQGVPVMIQTTCAVHAGASGGGVFNTRGELVAVVVCNSRDTTCGASYPHVNMCIPMATIAPVIQDYLITKDPAKLKSLETQNRIISRLWSIGSEAVSVKSQL